MRLYIRQKVFSWNDRFTVKDEAGNDIYFVEGKYFSIGKQLTVYTAQNIPVARVREKLFTFMPRFIVEVQGVPIAEIKRHITFLRPEYSVYGKEWLVSGDYFQHDYTITKGQWVVARIEKAWMSWGDFYCLDVTDPADHQAALAVVLAIDCATSEND